jgi:nucleoside-diphosphate-sugar epimerase
MRVLITGGSGFIGTHLVDSLLADGVLVWNVDKAVPPLSEHHRNWCQDDILDTWSLHAAFRTFQPTHVIHLAACGDLGRTRSLAAYADTTEGTRNVVEAIRDTPSIQRAIFASCMHVCRLGYRPTRDDDYAPASGYGQSKVLAEQIVRDAQLRCAWTLVRPATIWGPWHTGLRDGFLNLLCRGAYSHPDGGPVRSSYGYVGNIVHQLRCLLEAPHSQVDRQTMYLSDPPVELRQWASAFSRRLQNRDVPGGTRRWMALKALAGDVAELAGFKPPLTTSGLQAMTTENIVDTRPIVAIAGPGPYSVQQGIEQTAAWLEGTRPLPYRHQAPAEASQPKRRAA